PREIKAVLKSLSDNAGSGEITFAVPEGWRIEPSSYTFEKLGRNQEHAVKLLVYPSASESEGFISAIIKVGGKTYNQSLTVISYDHIPTQTLLPEAKSKVVRIDLRK